MAPDLPALAPERAFESLYRRHVDDVYRYALALLRNPADAEDVTQTTFLNAYRAVKRGEKIEKPQNWLIKIAHNAARSRYARAARRVSEVPLEDHLEQLAVPEVERPHVQDVLDALGRLPLNQRAALVMRELEGRTYVEIADTLGISVPAVETLIFRARRSLRVKASEIRVLSVIPAPGWLWELLDAGSIAGGGAAGAGGAALGGGAPVGGGTVLGGGTVMGSGFLLKAAVAIVAGVVASGINSDRPRQADAARSPSSISGFSAAAGKAHSGRAADGAPQAVGEAAPGAAGEATGASGRIGGVEAGAVPSGQQTGATQSAALGSAASGAGSPSTAVAGSATLSSAASPAASSSAATLPGSTQVVSTVVNTATNAVPRPTVPSLPVSVPVPPTPAVQVPAPPVQVPSPPVQVPSPPAVQLPSPAPVQLPPPPVHLP